MNISNWEILLSCEHAGNLLPDTWRYLKQTTSQEILDSHLGWDIGALSLAKILEKRLDVKLFYYPYTRLLIDLNRSNHRCFGKYTVGLEKNLKQRLLEELYEPYRKQINDYLEEKISNKKRILHLAIHSFTPSLNGKNRTSDLSLLYDPQRSNEKAFAKVFLALLKANHPDFRFRKNYPYLGKSDGLCTDLRKIYPNPCYMGIEVEVNQKHLQDKKQLQLVARLISQNLQTS